MIQLKKRLRDFLGIRPPVTIDNLRARPGQELEGVWFAYRQGINAERLLALYATTWVSTAIDRMASSAAAAALKVRYKGDPVREDTAHPLLELLGPGGRPNDQQDAFEFWEEHYAALDWAGNVFWYWESDGLLRDGVYAPRAVYHLEPGQVRVVPGRGRTVEKYIYMVLGQEFPLDPRAVTHFRRTNPFDRYYGLSLLESLRVEALSDRSMSYWNYQFFGQDVAVPAGIIVVPPEVPDKEITRMEDELAGRYGGRRRTAVMRAPVGGTAYYAQGISPRDMDFSEGRLLSRKAVYERLELPLGLMSENSTEANARVAERQLGKSIRGRQIRTRAKLNADTLGFWRNWSRREVDFEDLSAESADWDRESKHLQAVRPFMLENEVRTRLLSLPALSDNELQELRHVNGIRPTSDRAQPDRRDSDPLQREGQVRHLLDEGDETPSQSDAGETPLLPASAETG